MTGSNCTSHRQAVSASQNPPIFAWQYFAAAGILFAGVYLSQLFWLLDEPLFSKVYYGNVDILLFNICAAVYTLGFLALFHWRFLRHTGINFLPLKYTPVGPKRKLFLYFMTAIPVIVTGLALGGELKLVRGLGQNLTRMSLAGNATGYVYTAAKLFAAIYFILLVEAGVSKLLERCAAKNERLLPFARLPIPYGGLAAMVTFGLLEYLLAPSGLALLQLFLFLYAGIITLVANKQIWTAFPVSLIVFIL
ncbi:MAG: hypothetical protein E7223_06995 [Clostridiales bacterium]|nr:hypothetical protein [Clostridiales bacterium]